MFKNYFKIAWRNLFKNKAFTLLNLGGLTISFAVCIIIFCWVSNELNYDTAGTNADNVFRVALTLQSKGQPDKQFALTAAPLAPVLVKDFPEIDKATRIEFYGALMNVKSNHFFSDKFLFADSTFFDVFGFPLIAGNPHTALEGSNSAVITESIAKKYFGNENPIGKTITCNDTILLKVTGVAKDIPTNSHFSFEIVCAFNVLQQNNIDNTTNWWNDDYYTYISLKDKHAATALNEKITNIINKYNGADDVAMGIKGLHFLQPLKSIHLYSNLRNEINANGSITALRIFIAIAIFLLLVACINYINLTTATSFKRAKEIGVRKVAGAALRQLIAQFLCESVLLTLIALLLALGFAQLSIPLFNKIAETQISLSAYLPFNIILILIAFAVLLGTVAGIYPALYLSNVKPIKVFKNIREKKGSLLSLRKALVIFQFTLSVLLVIATIVALQQLHFMQSQNLGFNKEQVLAVPLRTQTESFQKEIIKNEFKKDAGVAMVTTSSSTPGKTLNNIVTLPEGVPQNAQQSMSTLVVDYDFIDTYKMQMAAGRAFSKNYPTDSNAFIINEAAVKEIGWGNSQNAIGKGFEWGLGKKGKIIGVVKDFHYNSMQQKVAPVVMHILPLYSGWYGYISVRINTKNAKQVIGDLQKTWKQLLPDHPFEYYFVDEDYNKQYQTEQRLGNLSAIFSVLTIFISCLGLFGLVMVAVSQRTKEIGVRKVLGASVAGITTLISKEFLKLVFIACLIAFPLSYWIMNKWLQSFAYRINISWWVFGVAGVAALLIALLTVSFQSIKAAMTNPVKSLRTE
jgi:putative ABC transport system permease protein